MRFYTFISKSYTIYISKKRQKTNEENNFITRSIDEHDKRIFRFTLTKKSISSLEKIAPMYDRAIEDIFSGSNERDILTTLRSIQTWKEQLTKMLASPAKTLK